MATQTVPGGQTVSNDEITNGNTLEVQTGGAAATTKVDSGGNLLIDSGGAETNATVLAGGIETVNGTINGSNAVTQSGTATGDLDYGVINVSSGGVASNITVESGGSLNLVLKSASASGVTVLTGGALTINGNAPANNVTLQGGTLELQSGKADTVNTSGAPSATGTLTFATGSSSRLQLDVAQTGTNGTTFAQTITGFAAGDVIDVANITGGTLTQTVNGANTNVTVTGGGASETFTFVGAAPAGLRAVADTSGAGGTDIVVCFVTGTAIRTARGDVAVEALAVGDVAATASGGHRPIRWIGSRTLAPGTGDGCPVRVRASAFGADLPQRDLWLSPGHPVLVGADETNAGGVLVPIMCLINGTSIARVAVATVTYWHVELEGAHDILLAEGLPAESYLDWGDRPFFDEASDHALHNPDHVAPGLSGRCRPVALDGPAVEAERRRLDALFSTSLAASCAWPSANGVSLDF